MTTTGGHAAQGEPATAARFNTTRWSLILEAGTASSPQNKTALEELCRAYWKPIYAFIRRLGNSPHDAQDLTQEFFARLLSSSSLERVDATKGRFRSFLLAMLKHFLANEWDKARTLKRGGHLTIIPFDPADAESALDVAGAASMSPDAAFDRQWAFSLLHRVLSRLQQEHEASGKSALFEHLKETLTSDRASLPYALIASRLGMSEGAVKVCVHRLRARYRELLQEEIAATVTDAADIKDELRDLFAALS